MMNSFYGGPQGLSFIIARSFSSVAEMVEKFKLGPAYDEVRFDEYVLINTKNKNDPTNGNIYRRGYNYTDDDKLGGALFVGSVVGPAGYTPALEFKSYEEVEDIWKDENYPESGEGWSYRGGTGAYTIATEDYIDDSGNKVLAGLVPGKTEENGEPVYNDELKWVYVSVRTTNNEECIACIGFKLPYHVPEFISSSVSPYYNRDNDSDTFVNQNLITRILEEDGEDLTKHPYYSKWDIKVPKGIKGHSVENVRVLTANDDINYPTESEENKEEDVSKEYKIFALDYRNYDATEEGEIETYYFGDYNMIDDVTLNTDNGEFQITYTHDDASKWELRWPKFLTLNEHGELTTIYTNGPTTVQTEKIKWITDVSTAPDGTITITYNTGTGTGVDFVPDKQILGSKLKWIDKTEILTGNPEGTGSQKVKITYNTGETSEIGNPLNYVIKTVISPENYHLLVYYADPAKRAADPRKVEFDGKPDWVDLGCVKDDSGILVGLNITDTEAGIETGEDVNLRDILNAELEYLNINYPEGLKDIPDVDEQRLKGKVVTFGEEFENKNFYAFDYEANEWYYLGQLDNGLINKILVELEDKINEVKDDIAQLEQDINENVKNQIDQINNQINNVNTTLNNRINNLETKVDTNTSNITDLTNRTDSIEDRVSVLEKDRSDILESLRKKINQLEKWHISVSNGLTPVLIDMSREFSSNDELLGVVGTTEDTYIPFDPEDTFVEQIMKLIEGMVILKGWKKEVMNGSSQVIVDAEGEYNSSTPLPDDVNSSSLVEFEPEDDLDDRLYSLVIGYKRLCIWKHNVLDGASNVLIDLTPPEQIIYPTTPTPTPPSIGGSTGSGDVNWDVKDDNYNTGEGGDGGETETPDPLPPGGGQGGYFPPAEGDNGGDLNNE